MTDRLVLTEEIKDAFRAYRMKHGYWAYFHVELEEGNIDNKFVRGLSDKASKDGQSKEVCRLAALLEQMSRTQRLRIKDICSA